MPHAALYVLYGNRNAYRFLSFVIGKGGKVHHREAVLPQYVGLVVGGRHAGAGGLQRHGAGALQVHIELAHAVFVKQVDIAVVRRHGCDIGGGFSLAMASDIRVCTKTARFSCFYANVGIGGCDMCSSYQLPRLIGTGRAYEMMLTGNFINADEAWNLGLVSQVVDDRAALVPAGLEFARVIAAKDPMAVRLTKEAMRCNVDASGFENALHVENRNQTLMIAHNMNKDASQDPIGKYWIEDRTDPMNPKGAN